MLDEVTGALIATHRQIADRTDLDLVGDTRWAALWQMSGRCLSTALVLIHDLRGGFTSDSIGTARALFEAIQLLNALAFHDEEDAVRRWLAGEWVRPREARAVQVRQQELALERMQQLGVEPEGGDLDELGRELYSILSGPAHHERAGFQSSISAELREFVFGAHPSAARRAGHLAYCGHLIEEMVIVVGDAFAEMIGREYVEGTVRPLQRHMEAVRAQYPIEEGD